MADSKNASKDAPAQVPEQPKQSDEVQRMTIIEQPAVPPMHAQRLDEVPWEGGGGRFLVNGQLVNHDGKPLNKDGSLKKDENT